MVEEYESQLARLQVALQDHELQSAKLQATNERLMADNRELLSIARADGGELQRCMTLIAEKEASTQEALRRLR